MSSSQGIRAGRAFVELFTKDDALRKGLAGAQKQVESFAKKVDSIGNKMLTVGAGIGAPMLAAAKIFADAGSELVDMSARTGIAVEQLSALKYVADQAGSGLGTFETGIKKMQKSIAAGGKEIASLGVDVNRLRSMAPEEQFLAIADAIAAIPDPAKRAAAAMKVFGKSGTDLLPMFAGGAAGIRAGMGEAAAKGQVMSTADAEAAEKFGDLMGDVEKQMRAIAIAVGSALMPSLTELGEWITKNSAEFRQWLADNQDLIVTLGQFAAANILLGGSLKTVAAGASLAGDAIKLMKAASKLDMVLVGWGALSAAIMVVAANLLIAIKNAKSFQEAVAKTGEELGAPVQSGKSGVGLHDWLDDRTFAEKIRSTRRPIETPGDPIGAMGTTVQKMIDDAIARAPTQQESDAFREMFDKQLSAAADKNLDAAVKQLEAAERFSKLYDDAQALGLSELPGNEWNDTMQRELLGVRGDVSDEERDQWVYDAGIAMQEAIVGDAEAFLDQMHDQQRQLERLPELLAEGSESAAKAMLDHFTRPQRQDPAVEMAQQQLDVARQQLEEMKRQQNLWKGGGVRVMVDGYDASV